jgi:uncharacterized MnhB-related membrane protein
MNVVVAVAMTVVGVFGLIVVLVRDPLCQTVVLGVFAMSMIVLFTVLQAPDVVLSAVVVGMFAFPMMVVLAIAKTRDRRS